MSETQNAHWSLDRRIPLALIGTVLFSTMGMVGAQAVAYYRLGIVEDRIARLEITDRQQERDAALNLATVREALGEVRGVNASLRDAVLRLESAIRDLRQQQPSSPPYGGR